MKKRSLFAAVAMLIVSAVILTSATYAWFNVGGPATINEFSVDTIEVSSGVMLKTPAVNWTGKLVVDSATFTTANGNTIAASYTPVSSATGENFVAYTYNSSTKGFDKGSSTSGYYTELYFSVGVITDGDAVQAKPVISGTGANAARVALLEITTSGGTSTETPIAVWGPDTTATEAIAPSATGLDALVDDGDYIVDSSDGTIPSGALVAQGVGSTPAITASGTAVSLGTFTKNYLDSSATVKNYVARIWVEGQDADCIPASQAGKTVTVGWTFEIPSNGG